MQSVSQTAAERLPPIALRSEVLVSFALVCRTLPRAPRMHSNDISPNMSESKSNSTQGKKVMLVMFFIQSFSALFSILRLHKRAP